MTRQSGLQCVLVGVLDAHLLRKQMCDLSRAAEKAMTIAADVCVYTNHNFTTEALRSEVTKEQPSKLLAGP